MNKINWIIALLNADNSTRIEGITRLEKLMFYLLQIMQEKDVEKDFKFEPYDYGPHSDDIRDILYALEDIKIVKIKKKSTDNFLTIDDIDLDEDDLKPIDYGKEEIFELTDLGKKLGEKITRNIKNSNSLDKFKEKFNSMPLNKLISIIYSKYPEMTKKSKILDKIMS